MHSVTSKYANFEEKNAMTLTFDLDLFSRSEVTKHIAVGFVSLRQIVYEF
jgi:hypothetical protein